MRTVIRMDKQVRDAYARVLEIQDYVVFSHNDYLYEIMESSNGGWMVEVFTVDFYHDIPAEGVDGGLCTGSPVDAIEFCLDSDETVEEERQ